MQLNNNPDTLAIHSLLGAHFYIPDYQRGYRWTPSNVGDLLDDIWEYRSNKETKGSFYCIQPLIVKAKTWSNASGKLYQGYEVIDGQQRLTTIHRILSYLKREYLKVNSLIDADYEHDVFSLYYQTRPGSNDFLSKDEVSNDNLDYYYMSQAYKTIKAWFTDKGRNLNRGDKENLLNTLLGKKDNNEYSVQFIWYEVESNEDSIDLFTRFNRGKIPLTSGELIKARLLNSKSFIKDGRDNEIRKKTEIVQIWDEIEQSLNDEKFWAFVTNKNAIDYSSKINLLFDIKTRNNQDADPLFSFIHFFDKKETEETLWDKWLTIEKYYSALKFWYQDKHYYHKIGYLVAANVEMADLLDQFYNSERKEFEKWLDIEISKTLKYNFSILNYNNPSHKQDITKVLLLFNLETIRNNNNKYDYFPFGQYKAMSKSIEHIHAQNTAAISKTDKKQWVSWLDDHKAILTNITNNADGISELINELNSSVHKLNYDLFTELSIKVIKFLSDQEAEQEEYMHRIENLALLGSIQNTILSNSVFEVKRIRITELDKDGGAYLPICTKRVFFKYYNAEESEKLNVWTKKDRERYLAAIEKQLEIYLNLKTSDTDNEN